jgi:outer membrane lipopolysaccharide assembly protein LptE/RlpB
VSEAQLTSSNGRRAAHRRALSRTICFLLGPVVLSLAACGYHTAGHNVTLPENVKTLAIPAFVNQSQTYRVEQMLTAAVVREFTTRTHYQILHSESAAADATLHGTVLTTTASPLTYDSKTGRAESVLVVVSMKVSLVDRDGKILFQNPVYIFREQYQVSQELSSFFEEDSPAMGRLSRDFAQTLVSNVLEGF